MFWVVLGSLVIAIPAAWLVAKCHFPGRRMFQWALLLPLAMPAYVVAYVYTDLLDYAGPIQGGLRRFFWLAVAAGLFFSRSTFVRWCSYYAGASVVSLYIFVS